MDDPSWAWPAWKFDMKRGDLFTKLHDQYNTYPSPIQDPDRVESTPRAVRWHSWTTTRPG
ncbi:hypothetical protein EDB81DRAFT_800059 [Dactylonectria macrodidyma]|uniref:Uncharacterized protein n=1 Tax=Dactylonectria macrodidyma TaxID=307937 RepID=A0A9P9EGZ6_9HYPO|nr:hypothetical protein EDB81DRAFT_800059 [Dactylonectria macrodidyma]